MPNNPDTKHSLDHLSFEELVDGVERGANPLWEIELSIRVERGIDALEEAGWFDDG